MKLARNCKLLMIGDSITDCGRARPVGEARNDALGNGYVLLVNALLQTAYPAQRIRVMNVGTSGNTVRDLKARWDTDVIALKPDWVSIMIGINDVWRQFDSPLRREELVLPREYRATLDELVVRTLPLVKGLVLMTPYYIEPNPRDAMRARMDEYGGIVKQVAKKHGTVLVDTQAAFARVLATMYPAELAWDRVHPNMTGHMVLAKAFLKAIGAKG